MFFIVVVVVHQPMLLSYVKTFSLVFDNVCNIYFLENHS